MRFIKRLAYKFEDFETKRVEFICNLCDIFSTSIVEDSKGNEFVVPTGSVFVIKQFIDNITDKTELEAGVSHIHVLDKITKREYKTICKCGKDLCNAVLGYLCNRHPGKRFYVYLTATVGDSIIVRFHQIWEGEEPFYEGPYIRKKACILCSHN